jgi:hypothetical protein
MATSATGGYLTPTTPLPLDDEELGRRLSNLVAGVTGLPGSMVRPRWQPVAPPLPLPSQDWAAVGVISYPSGSGAPQAIHIPDGDGHDLQVRDEEIDCLASFYGPHCSALARLCRTGLWVPQNWEQLLPLGMNLRDTGAITIVPENINEAWYRRADLSFTLVQDLRRAYAVLNILSAQGLIHGQGSSPQTVNVPFDTENVE